MAQVSTPMSMSILGKLHNFLPGGAAILTITSFLSYALGLWRDRTFAQTFGAGSELDAYNASFIIPDLLLNIFVAGALAAGFIPVFSGLLAKQNKKEAPLRPPGADYAGQADQLASSVINSAVIAMLIGGILIFIFAPYFAKITAPGFSEQNRVLLVNLTRIMALSPIIFALSNSLGGMLVSYKKFLFYGLSPALYNLGIIAGTFFLAPIIGIYGAAMGTISGALLHLAIRIIGVGIQDTHDREYLVYRYLYTLKIRIDKNYKTVLRLMIPKMFGHPVEMLTFWGFTAIASTLGAGNITALNFARNFQSLPVSLFGIAFATAVFPVLSALAAQGDFVNYKKQFLKTLRAILFFAGVSAIFIFFAKTLLIKIFLGGGEFSEQDILLTASTLGVFTLAIPTESASHLAARSFYALKNTVIPVAASILALGITVLVGYVLSKELGLLALPLGFFAGSLFKTIVLLVLLNRRIKFTN